MWADSIDALIPTAQVLEKALLGLIRGGKRLNRISPSTPNLIGQLPNALSVPESIIDPEKALEDVSAVRPHSYIGAFANGLALMLTCILVGLGISKWCYG